MKKNELILNNENIKMTLKKDSLNRKLVLLKLIKLLNVLDDNYVISIDGDWGVGKTFFIKQLQYLYQEDNLKEYIDEKNIAIVDEFKTKYVPIYYNAWENDDHENVIESLMYNILDVYPKYKEDILKKDQDFKSIFKTALLNFVDKSSLGLLSKDVFEQIKSFEDLSQNIITSEEKKKSLYEILDLLTQNGSRILLIIDELDRCKPDYAVKVLETIKHFYNYKRIACLVVTNNEQLSESIKHFYGNNLDGYGYLNKMYDTVLSLTTNNIEKYLQDYLGFYNDSYLSKEMSITLIKYFNFSLRECNSYINMYRLSIKYINYSRGFNAEEFIIPSNIFLPIGLALKVKNIKEFNKFIKGNSDEFFKMLIEFIKNEEKGDKYVSWFNRIFKIKDGEKLEDKIIEEYHKCIKFSNRTYDNFPLLEALSLMGNLVNYDDTNES